VHFSLPFPTGLGAERNTTFLRIILTNTFLSIILVLNKETKFLKMVEIFFLSYIINNRKLILTKDILLFRI